MIIPHYSMLAKYLTISAIGLSLLALLLFYVYDYAKKDQQLKCETRITEALDNEYAKFEELNKANDTVRNLSDDELDNWLLDHNGFRE